jgi:hypothetical protein
VVDADQFSYSGASFQVAHEETRVATQVNGKMELVPDNIIQSFYQPLPYLLSQVLVLVRVFEPGRPVPLNTLHAAIKKLGIGT